MQATQAGQAPKELALFDLDHTLLDVDSDYLWGEYIVKHNLVDEAEYRTANQKFIKIISKVRSMRPNTMNLSRNF